MTIIQFILVVSHVETKPHTSANCAVHFALIVQGFIQEFVLGGGNFVSGEQWACLARPPRGGLGVLPQKIFEKVSALRLILVEFGNQALITVVIAPIPVNCL